MEKKKWNLTYSVEILGLWENFGPKSKYVSK